MIFFSPNLLKLFQYYPKIQSIFILSPSYLHLISIHSPFIVRSLFVFCSFIVRLLFVHCSFIVRSLFVHCSFFVRLLFVLCSFARAARTVFCSFFVRSLFVLAPNNLQFATLFPSSKNFSHFISHLLIFKFANSTYPCTTLYLLSFTFYLLTPSLIINHYLNFIKKSSYFQKNIIPLSLF